MFSCNIFCERLKALRISKGLTQSQLGEILKLSKPAISDLERGRRMTTFGKLVEIADLYGVSVDYLLGRTDNPKMNK